MMAIKREKDLMDRMGFTPKTMENNNGEPVYQNTAENDDENEGEQEK